LTKGKPRSFDRLDVETSSRLDAENEKGDDLMPEKFPLGTAKKADELAKVYSEVKTAAKDYGFKAVAELKADVVKKAMADSKKAADFIVEVDAAKTMTVQLVCDVKGKLRSVLGRNEIKSVDDYKKAIKLGSNANLKKVAAENHWI
jgi:hypothetical protein